MRVEGMFAGRAALVTGGTRGIGAAVAADLARLGARVVAAGLDAAAAPAEVRAAAGVVDLDVTVPGAVEELVAGLDRLDVLVNCAGTISRELEYDPAVFGRVVDVNLTGTMRACVAAHDLLAAAGGSVVNLASMLSFFGGPHAPAYSASKGAVVQLTRSLAVRYAPDGVRVNAIAPGWIRTPLTAALQEDPAAEGRILARTPMGRWGGVEDVLGAVAFLASPDAGFITGAVLPIDGGYHAA